jgi:hypothetical protein
MADATMSHVSKKSGKEIHAAWAKDLINAAAGKGASPAVRHGEIEVGDARALVRKQ